MSEIRERVQPGGTAVAGTGEAAAAGAESLHPPASSTWPFVLGAGVTLLLFGLLTSLAFSLLGLVLAAMALAGWIREVRHERPH